MSLQEPLPLMSIFQCARQVMFVTNDPAYPVSFQGSGFIVWFRSRLFVITAQHVMRGFEPAQIRIQYHPDGTDFLPLLRPYTISGEDAEDTDQYDIVVFSCDESKLDTSCFKGYLPYNLQEEDAFTIFNPKFHFAFRGFPAALRTTYYEERRVEMMSMLANSSYIGSTEREEIHQLRIINRDREILDFNGISGSPVFQIWHENDRISNQAFAGMLIHGSVTSGIVEFLEHRKIIDVLVRIVEGDTEPSVI